MSNLPHNDAVLIDQARRDRSPASLEAFNALVLRYQDSLYALTYRIMGDHQTADDVTQAAFIAAYNRLNTYQGGSFKAWLMRIATNQAYDELRRHKRRPTVSVDELPGSENDDGAPLPDPALTPEQVSEQHDLQRAIQACIDALSTDYRTVLVLCDIEGYDYAAIASITDAALGTVKSRLSRARAQVRDCLSAVQELLPVRFRLKGD
ncbi:MAG: sigma-70 family RNA polymerase sigma factor [bacterium]|nr:sigma-70 family RNA polymerase sigma factor [bacterium]